MPTEVEGRHIHISGIVQGVGFRPFVYELAIRYKLAGWVLNNSSGVEIEVIGPAQSLEAFTSALQTEKPPLAVIDSIRAEKILRQAPISNGQSPRFEIRHSQAQANAFVPISPDICICDDCLHELFDPTDRRYHYPFTNCTNCGPRFTIIRDIPYDRPLTTMVDFPMCADCQGE
jgi:hydrogenase maturation protein HypF